MKRRLQFSIFDHPMIQNRNILCLSTPAWEGAYASTTVQLMKELAKHNKVLFVQNPFTVKDVADGLKRKKQVPFKKVFGLKARLKSIPSQNGNGAFVLTPPMMLSVNFLPKGAVYKLMLRFNGWLVKQTIKKHLRQLKMEEALVHIISFNPALGLQIGREFNESVLLYLCYDEISAAPHLKKHGVWLEEEFGKIADATIVTSQGLLERKRHLSERCYLVKNAANFALFSKGFNPNIQQKKIVGFIGGIDRRLDYPLLEYIIGNMPNVEFQFVGRQVYPAGEEILKKYSNVVLIGPKKLSELPKYASHFSAGIIPFKLSNFIKTVYPLKINEYLAAGVPVVTTNFSYLDEFKPVVSIAENKEEFMKMLLTELETDSIEKKRARQQMASLNSWEHRAEELSGVITELESLKKGV